MKLVLSIVIPCWRRIDLLALCLASVQKYAPRGTEVIVVDDASSQSIVSKAAAEFVGVQVVRLARRKGFCGAVNAGVAAAGGHIVEVLNDDTEVTAGWAAAALAWFRDANIGAVAPLVLLGPEGDRIDSAGDRYFAGGVAAKRCHGEPVNQAPTLPGPVFGASGSSAFYRRDLLISIGGFPEDFTAYFDDVDVAFRLQRARRRTIFEPASRVLHRIGASHGKPSRRLLEQLSRNEERVYWRNLPAGALARTLPRHLAVLAGKAMRRWRQGTLRPFLCGRVRLLGEVRQLLKHRHWLATIGPAAPLETWGVEWRYWS
jgi:GT2 family glycosyltransferase